MRDPYDIFISYSQKDGEIAASLASRFDDAGLKCFLADKSILAAAEWDTVLRDAIRGANRILVLLTPRSKDSLWVAAEIGAAWVLGKPLIPALMFVEPQDLLEPVRKYQTRSVETPQQIDALVREIKESSFESLSLTRGIGTTRSIRRGAFSTPAALQESFTSPAGWGQLLKVGEWKFDAARNEFVGEGMYRYVLSHHTYGPEPFAIDCRLTFLDLKPEGTVNAVNAGIVLGWSTPAVAPQYFHLAFSGEQLFFEKVGSRGLDEYLDFEHLGPDIPFRLEAGVPYELSVRVAADRLRVSCNGREIFDTGLQPGAIAGRVGLRPWRSTLSCQRFEVRTEG
jgi:TIR domain